MREHCCRCRRPATACLCALTPAMETAVKLVLLMHPHEVRRVKNGTGRITALSFRDAEIIEGVRFDGQPRLAALLRDPAYLPMLLYPGPGSRDLSHGGLRPEDLAGRRLLILLLDATWPLAKKMLRESPVLQALPRLMFTPAQKSRWVIKRQPAELCLSTLEAVHELMLGLEAAGLGPYEKPGQLLAAFAALQNYQVSRKTGTGGGEGALPWGSAGYRPRAKKKRALFFQDKA